MESITFEDDKISITAVFYDNMVKLEGTYIFDTMPPGDLYEHPCRIEPLEDGRYKMKAEIFIPNGIIYDALCINDKRVIDGFNSWLKDIVDNIAQARGIKKATRMNFEKAN